MSKTRETLKDFLNSNGSGADKISFIPSNEPDGIGKDPNTGKDLLDLNNNLSGLLGDYLKYVIDQSSNSYKLKGGNELASSSNKGDDLVLPDLQGAENVFVEQGTIRASKLNEYSNSGYFDSAGENLSNLVDKVGNNFSNHEILKDIEGRNLDDSGRIRVNPEGEDNKIIKASQKVLVKNNRFSNVADPKSTAFTNESKNIKDFESGEKGEGTISNQNEFGKFNRDSETFSIDDLKSLGASIIFSASGYQTDDIKSFNSDVIKELESTQSSYVTSAGFSKKDVQNFRLKYTGKNEFLSSDNESNNVDSFGVTYNTDYTFTLNRFKKHRIEAAATLIVLKNIGKSFYSNFLNFLKQGDVNILEQTTKNYISSNSAVNPFDYLVGESKSFTSFKADALMKRTLAITSYPYGDCIDEGLKLILSDDFDNVKKASESDFISSAPGFWLAVSKSVLKRYNSFYKRYENLFLDSASSSDLSFNFFKDLYSSNPIVSFFNALAIMGDSKLKASGGIKGSTKSKNPRDLDSIPDNKAIIGKSRKKFGNYKNNLTWDQDSTPSMYILPANIIRAASKLNNTVYGENPARGMFGSKLVKNTYTGLDVDGEYNRIPNRVVKILEDKLDAEYVPFYIQDLRTNEVVSFNAFLDQLTDSISSDYNAVSGYGRLDPVQIYKGTSRNIQVGFTLYATNREDFDAMWYKINKFVTLLYPQWTSGTKVSNNPKENSRFYQPFSQVIGASPIVRLRIGDVVKSNYSKFALSRLFGIGDPNISPKAKESSSLARSSFEKISSDDLDALSEKSLRVLLTVFGSPHSLVNIASDIDNDETFSSKLTKNAKIGVASNLLSKFLINGFANPLVAKNIIEKMRDPNADPSLLSESLEFRKFSLSGIERSINASSLANINVGYRKLDPVILKSNFNTGYYCEDDGKIYLFPRETKVRIIEKGIFDNSGKVKYRIKMRDASSQAGYFLKTFIVDHTDLYPEPNELFNYSAFGIALLTANITGVADEALSIANDYLISSGISNDAIDLIRSLYEKDESTFMRKETNPYVRAIESTKGRGLAGVIKSVTFDWLNESFPWEIDHNSRAPIGCKISFGFDVIHDIPPGLDSSGYNRAPLYNVGGIMKSISGDVHDDYGRQSEFNYREQGHIGSRTFGNEVK